MNNFSNTKQNCKNKNINSAKKKPNNIISNNNKNYPNKIYSPKKPISTLKKNNPKKLDSININSKSPIKNKQIKTKYIKFNEFSKNNSSTGKISKLKTSDRSSSNINNITNSEAPCTPKKNKDVSKFKNISEENKIEVDANKQVFNINGNKNIFTFNDLKNKLLNDTKNKNQLKINNDIINNKEDIKNKFLFSRDSFQLNNPEKIEEEKNYQLKRYRYLINYKYTLNPIKRCENAQKIQKWWRKQIHPKILKREKIIKIQKVFRGYITRKSLNNIICVSILYQNFIKKLRHALSNCVRRNYFPKRYYKKKYALEKIFPLKLKLFFRKWKNVNETFNNKVEKARDMLNKRENKRYILVILKTYFDIWKLKCEQYRKNEEKKLSLSNQEKKFYALFDLINKIQNIRKKKALKIIKDPLNNFLLEELKNNAANLFIKKYNKYNEKGKLKKYFDLWFKQILKMRKKQHELELSKNNIKHMLLNNDKENLRTVLNNIRSKTNIMTLNELKNVKKNVIFPYANKFITNYIRRNILRKIFKKYISKRKFLIKLNSLIMKKIIKYYWNKWKNVKNKLSHVIKRDLLLKKLINNINRICYSKNIAKYFNRWRQKQFSGKYLNDNIYKYKTLCEVLKKFFLYKNKKIRDMKKDFLIHKLKNYINKDKKLKKLFKIVSKKINSKEKIDKKQAFEKWKSYLNNEKIKDLKYKNFASIAKYSKIAHDVKIISKSLNNWKNKNQLMNLIDIKNKNQNLVTAIHLLNNIKNNKLKEFFTILTIAKTNLYKKIIIGNIIKNHNKNKLRKYFNKWKINQIKTTHNNHFINTNKISKLRNILTNKIKTMRNNKYNILKKYIYKWYFNSKIITKNNENQFLRNINTAVDIIEKLIKLKLLEIPFQNIKKSKINTNNKSLLKLKKYFILNDNKNLHNTLQKLRNNTLSKSNLITKAKILYNLKLKNDKSKKNFILNKYFNIWKINSNIKSQNIKNNTKFLYAKLNKIYFLSNKKTFYNKIRENRFNKLSIKYAQNLYNIYKSKKYKILNEAIAKWKKNSTKFSEIINNKTKASELIYNKLVKIYSYQKLEKNLIPLLIKNYKNRYLKTFLDNLKILYQSKINYSYKTSIKNIDELVSNKTHFRFKKKINLINNPKKVHVLIQKVEKQIQETKKYRNIIEKSKRNYTRVSLTQQTIITRNDLLYLRLTPSLIKLLNRLRIKKFENFFEFLKDNKTAKKFSEIYTSFSIGNLKLKKSTLIFQMQNIRCKNKLYKLFRKRLLYQITKIELVKIKQKTKILKLFKITGIYLKKNKYKNISKIIRIWRFYTKLMIDRRKKMEFFTKSFNNVYEQISEDLFVDKNEEESIQSQFMDFLDKLNENEKNQIKNDLNISNKSIKSYLSSSINNEMKKIYHENTSAGMNSISNFRLKNSVKENESPSKFSKLSSKIENKTNFDFSDSTNVNSINNNINSSKESNIKSSLFCEMEK